MRCEDRTSKSSGLPGYEAVDVDPVMLRSPLPPQDDVDAGEDRVEPGRPDPAYVIGQS